MKFLPASFYGGLGSNFDDGELKGNELRLEEINLQPFPRFKLQIEL